MWGLDTQLNSISYLTIQTSARGKKVFSILKTILLPEYNKCPFLKKEILLQWRAGSFMLVIVKEIKTAACY